MPTYVWEALLHCLSTDDRKEFEALVEKVECKPDKKAIAAELKNGTAVPGADLAFGQVCKRRSAQAREVTRVFWLRPTRTRSVRGSTASPFDTRICRWENSARQWRLVIA